MKRSGSAVAVDVCLRSEGSLEDLPSDSKRGDDDDEAHATEAGIQLEETSVWKKSLMMLVSNPPGSYVDSKVSIRIKDFCKFRLTSIRATVCNGFDHACVVWRNHGDRSAMSSWIFRWPYLAVRF
jgi:hypothetical protein